MSGEIPYLLQLLSKWCEDEDGKWKLCEKEPGTIQHGRL